jgi:hypothetical protein
MIKDEGAWRYSRELPRQVIGAHCMRSNCSGIIADLRSHPSLATPPVGAAQHGALTLWFRAPAHHPDSNPSLFFEYAPPLSITNDVVADAALPAYSVRDGLIMLFQQIVAEIIR